MFARFLNQRTCSAVPNRFTAAAPRSATRCLLSRRTNKLSLSLRPTSLVISRSTGVFATPTLLSQCRAASTAYTSRIHCVRFDVDTSDLARVTEQPMLPPIANLFLLDVRKKRNSTRRLNTRKTMSSVMVKHRTEAQRAAAAANPTVAGGDGQRVADETYVPPPLIFLVKTTDTVKQAAQRQETLAAQLRDLGAKGDFYVCVLTGSQTAHWTRYVGPASATPNTRSVETATAAAAVAVGGEDAAENEAAWEDVDVEGGQGEREDGADGRAGSDLDGQPKANSGRSDTAPVTSTSANKADQTSTNTTSSSSTGQQVYDASHAEGTADSDAAATPSPADAPPKAEEGFEDFDIDGQSPLTMHDVALSTNEASAAAAAAAAAPSIAPTPTAPAPIDDASATAAEKPVKNPSSSSSYSPPPPPTPTVQKEAVAVSAASTKVPPAGPAEVPQDEPTGTTPAGVPADAIHAEKAVVHAAKTFPEAALTPKVTPIVEVAPMPEPPTPMPVYLDTPARLYKGAETSHLSDRALLELPVSANVLVIDRLDWTAANSAALEAALAQVDPIVGHVLLHRDAYVLQVERTVKENHTFRDVLVPFIFVFRTGLSRADAAVVQRRFAVALRRRPSGLTAVQQSVVAGLRDRMLVCVLSAEETEKGGEDPLADPDARVRQTAAGAAITTAAGRSGSPPRHDSADLGVDGEDGGMLARVSLLREEFMETAGEVQAEEVPTAGVDAERHPTAHRSSSLLHGRRKLRTRAVRDATHGSTTHPGNSLESASPPPTSAAPAAADEDAVATSALGLLGFGEIYFGKRPSRHEYWMPRVQGADGDEGPAKGKESGTSPRSAEKDEARPGSANTSPKDTTSVDGKTAALAAASTVVKGGVAARPRRRSRNRSGSKKKKAATTPATAAAAAAITSAAAVSASVGAGDSEEIVAIKTEAALSAAALEDFMRNSFGDAVSLDLEERVDAPTSVASTRSTLKAAGRRRKT